MGKPYRTDATYALTSIVAPAGDRGGQREGVAALAGLWDTGGTAYIGERQSALFRLPRVPADQLQIWLPAHWTTGEPGSRVVTRVETAYVDVGHVGRELGVVARVYAVRPGGARLRLAPARLIVDIDGGEIRVEED